MKQWTFDEQDVIALFSGSRLNGDDAAELRLYGSDIVISTDSFQESTHFNSHVMNPHHIGYRAVIASISDIYAMGHSPSHILINLGIGKDINFSLLRTLSEGVVEAASNYSCEIIGGDTYVQERGITLTVTALGKRAGSSLSIHGAQEGNLLYCSRDVGDSKYSLQIFLNGAKKNYRERLSHFAKPRPEVRAPKIKSFARVTAATDISDGICLDAQKLIRQKPLDVALELSSLPTAPLLRADLELSQTKKLEIAATSGEEFALLFAIQKENKSDFENRFLSTFGENISPIGEFHKGSGKVRCTLDSKPFPLSEKCFSHFA